MLHLESTLRSSLRPLSFQEDVRLHVRLVNTGTMPCETPFVSDSLDVSLQLRRLPSGEPREQRTFRRIPGRARRSLTHSLAEGESIAYDLTLQDYFSEQAPGDYEARVIVEKPELLRSQWLRFSVLAPQLRAWSVAASAESRAPYLHIAWVDAGASPPRLLLQQLRTEDLGRSFSTVVDELAALPAELLLSSTTEGRASSHLWLAAQTNTRLDVSLVRERDKKLGIHPLPQRVSRAISPLLIEPDRTTDETGFTALVQDGSAWYWLERDTSGNTRTRKAELGGSAEHVAVAHTAGARRWVAWIPPPVHGNQVLRLALAGAEQGAVTLTELSGQVLSIRARIVADRIEVVTLTLDPTRETALLVMRAVIDESMTERPQITNIPLAAPPTTKAPRTASIAFTERGPWVGLWYGAGMRALYAPSGRFVVSDNVPIAPHEELVGGADHVNLVTWTEELGWQTTRMLE